MAAKWDPEAPGCWGLSLSTSAANQTAVYLQVYEGERLQAKDNTLLGTFALEGIAEAPAGTPKVWPLCGNSGRMPGLFGIRYLLHTRCHCPLQ